MPNVAVEDKYIVTSKRTVRLADPGDIITLDRNYYMNVFVRQGLNASSFQDVIGDEDFYRAYTGPSHFFIVIATVGIYPLIIHDHWHEQERNILLMPLTVQAIEDDVIKLDKFMDVNGPLVLMRQIESKDNHSIGEVVTNPETKSQSVTLDYSKILQSSHPSILPRITQGMHYEGVHHVARYLEAVTKAASANKQVAKAEAAKAIGRMTRALKVAARKLVEAKRLDAKGPHGEESSISILETSFKYGMEKAEKEMPLLPRILPKTPGEHVIAWNKG